eukprot:m.233317 g.233317  ORF g.233317 m.233317 type:complete len:122 (+) comp16024_c0_seq1:22-387(+)
MFSVLLTTTLILAVNANPSTSSLYSYVGFFPDGNDGELPYQAAVRDDWMTIDRCHYLCSNDPEASYEYFGVQWGDECYCGNEMPGKYLVHLNYYIYLNYLNYYNKAPPYRDMRPEDHLLCE